MIENETTDMTYKEHREKYGHTIKDEFEVIFSLFALLTFLTVGWAWEIVKEKFDIG